MALLGEAALAMWWDIAPNRRDEFEHWHSHEHFPERMGIPGFRRGSRWASADGGEGFFVLYELERHETLSSPAYLARLNAPTPWSTKLMPHHRNMVRSQCVVLDSAGSGLARQVLTVRLSPAAGDETRLRDHLTVLGRERAAAPGLTGAHLLQTRTPAIAQTHEQRLRGGGDGAADWIWLVHGYDEAALRALGDRCRDEDALQRAGATGAVQAGLYSLSHSASSEAALR
ncbi:MAG TPA: hypothetical protein PKA20_30565 [Burkholderiaceae bacterium]|nr:hypothetical protein [Burkholderiaceae bacterium]